MYDRQGKNLSILWKGYEAKLMSNIQYYETLYNFFKLFYFFSVYFNVYMSVYDFLCVFALCKSELEGPSCTEGFV